MAEHDQVFVADASASRFPRIGIPPSTSEVRLRSSCVQRRAVQLGGRPRTAQVVHLHDGVARVREWYNGYSWRGAEKNDGAMLRRWEFEAHWFETTPAFLVDTSAGSPRCR